MLTIFNLFSGNTSRPDFNLKEISFSESSLKSVDPQILLKTMDIIGNLLLHNF